MMNQSHRNVKWCIDMRKSNKVLEDGIFKLCNGSMVPFVTNDKKNIGPEGELKPNESFELKILFCPGKFFILFSTKSIQIKQFFFIISIIDKPGVYTCNFPIVINNNFEQPYYNIQVVGELLSPEITFEPEVLVLKPVPLGVEVTEKLIIKQKGYEQKSKLKLEVCKAKTIEGEHTNVLDVNFVNEPGTCLFSHFCSIV